ncbi:hypothetical protein [Enterococcus faecalis]|uniref:hypothetical protein n=1 Tax=Enterococcus faecalis TaxID=1351 RepID=UPI000C9A1DB7|nr:hypothetical protein [Enterococcus faecalis]
MSQLIQNIKLKQQQKKQQELQEQEILKKLISNNNLLIRDLKKLEENNSNSESRLIQLREDLEYVEDLYTQLFLLLEDTYERFQHIQRRMNTDKNLKKEEKSKKKNSKSKIREVTTEDDINHIKAMMTTLLDHYDKTLTVNK